MLKMPTPVNDATAALKLCPQKTEQALKKVATWNNTGYLPQGFYCT